MARERSKLIRMLFSHQLSETRCKEATSSHRRLKVVLHVLKEELRGGERAEGCCESSAEKLRQAESGISS